MVKNEWLTDYLIKITLLTNFIFTVDIYCAIFSSSFNA